MSNLATANTSTATTYLAEISGKVQGVGRWVHGWTAHPTAAAAAAAVAAAVAEGYVGFVREVLTAPGYEPVDEWWG